MPYVSCRADASFRPKLTTAQIGSARQKNKKMSSARNFEQLHFFYQLLERTYARTYGILFSVEQMPFFCRAVEIPKKSVEQSRFEQMDFEQLTLTH
jgi:hypothetical protein